MSTDIATRDEAGKFAPGVSGNPGGRPKQIKEVVDLARTHTTFAIEQLAEIAGDKRAAAMARVRAAEVLLDRGWGKSAVETEIGGDVGNVTFVFRLGDRDGGGEPAQAGELIAETDQLAAAQPG